ncbi:eukaryotic translation initiation factor 2 alpha subunit-domain-containing protein [Blyttiomyces helicus]|uniref:Eukaryotic translation initiation factor 2 subunit alpha n=1 Tax=Blyttiomyces helicus TaxID=388810 RepID=A0A4P9VZJ2_9FUNG|nr:eukaryotic translation initiation factor 2 alpha subunit-domain-containing protein [Blyttiomyces helicus]|eukprot:RKO85241.1 eukaryotic translation initiation factor 2 alpha subunit-domain-containing protein [Blyttiomyces helicus]
MYENRYPEVDSLVMVSVRQIAEMGVYVRLLEFNNTEGMILLSELSRRRIRSIQKLVRVGRNEVVVVLRVDKEKGYIDLSKRRVSAEDVAKCEEKFNKSKAVHSIMRHVAEKLDKTLEELNTAYTWPLYKKYGHAFDAFKLAINEPEKVFEGLNMPEDVQNELVANIARRLTPQKIKIRADIDVTCFAYEGIDAIKAALTAGEACSTADASVKIKLVAPPLYVMITHSLDKTQGIEVLEKAIAKIEETISRSNGALTVKMKPRAVSETDDLELAQLMARVERENAEISGDESGSDDEDAPAAEAAGGEGAGEEDEE